MAAAWGSGSPAVRRVLLMQRLGAFFQEMRASQQVAGPPWMPSPFPTTPVSTAGRRMLGSPETDPGPRGIQPLFSRDQRAEMRAPLLYGPSVGQNHGEPSSGGSTAEAVQEEVRKQLRGVMDELAESRREAGSLCEEIQRLPNQADRPQQALLEPEGLPRVFGGYLADASGVTMPMTMPRGSGSAPMPLSMPQVSGAASMPPSMPQVSGAASMPLSMPRSTYATEYASGVGHSICATEYASGIGLSTYVNEYASMFGRSMCATEYASGIGRSTYINAYDSGVQQWSFAAWCVRWSRGHNVSASAGDPVMKLIQGLEAVLTKSSTKAQEEVTKSAVEAPRLAELSEASAIDFGDWMHCLENVMGDLSTNSGEWWRAVLQDAQDYYRKYMEEDQFARLMLKPVASSEVVDSKWMRVDRRGAALIMNAVPEEVKRELVASRSRTTLELLSKLMIMYRPGSVTEKSQLLKNIEAPEAATNVSEAVDHLRQWVRYYRRAKDLGLSTPDPSILLRALDGLVKRPLQEHHDITFRMSLLRRSLKVDFTPTETSVMTIQQAYLAEFEQVGFRRSRPNSGAQQPQLPKIKAIEMPPGTTPMPTPSPKTGPRPCRFFLSDDGCRRGKDCKYEHSMNSLSKTEKRERCYVCGAKGHMSSNCPQKPRSRSRLWQLCKVTPLSLLREELPTGRVKEEHEAKLPPRWDRQQYSLPQQLPQPRCLPSCRKCKVCPWSSCWRTHRS